MSECTKENYANYFRYVVSGSIRLVQGYDQLYYRGVQLNINKYI